MFYVSTMINEINNYYVYKKVDFDFEGEVGAVADRMWRCEAYGVKGDEARDCNKKRLNFLPSYNKIENERVIIATLDLLEPFSLVKICSFG